MVFAEEENDGNDGNVSLSRWSVDSSVTVAAANYAGDNDTNFHRAWHAAAWVGLFDYGAFKGNDGRQVQFSLPDNVTGRYVRVQVETPDTALALAEVQVCSDALHRLSG